MKTEKIALIADVHVGNHKRFGGPVRSGINERAALVIDVLGKAKQEAVANGCTALVVLGDLYDHSKPEPQIITAVQQALCANDGCPVYMLLGNHDQHSDAAGDHALGPHGGRAYLVEQPAVLPMGHTTLLMLPFHPKPAGQWLQENVERWAAQLGKRSAGDGSRVLLLHAGVWDDNTPDFLKGANDAVSVDALTEAAERLECSWVFCGNWHNRQLWQDTGRPSILQVGSLCPTGWDNPGLKGYGTLAIFDTRSSALLVREIMGPRFLVLHSAEELAGIQQRPGESLYVQVPTSPEQRASVVGLVESARQMGRIHQGEVVIDGRKAKTELADAARTVRSAASLDEALSGYVGKMPLEEPLQDVDRAEVQARASRLLASDKEV